jgi:hypothetical protein
MRLAQTAAQPLMASTSIGQTVVEVSMSQHRSARRQDVSAVPVLICPAGRPHARNRRAPAWDSGIPAFKARMPYTATTHANLVRVTCELLHRPDIHGLRESDDPAGRAGLVDYRFEVTPTFMRCLYRPPARVLETIGNLARRSRAAT